MTDPKLDQLKLKYQSVLNLMDTLKVQLKNLHVHEDKLVIRGEAKTKDDVNKVWNQIKLVEKDYKQDLMAEITFLSDAPAPKPQTAPTLRIHKVVAGDTLSKIAQTYYGKASDYMKIFNANKNILTGSQQDQRRPGTDHSLKTHLKTRSNHMLKDLLQNILGGAKTPNSSLLESGIKMLLNPQGPTGGLPGLLEMFQKKGLGNIVESWIGMEPNKKISARKVKKGLGPDVLGQIAGAVGLPKGVAGAQLAKYLPKIIDKLTPQGQIPKETNLADKGLELLKGLF